jgi:rod shape determining protein RodA
VKVLLQNFKLMNHAISIVMLLLMGIGVTFIYSAGVNSVIPVSEGLWRKQLYFIGVGFVIYILFANINYRILVRYSWLIYLFGILLLLLVFVPEIGIKRYGSRRWIGLASVQIQPSEIMKVAVVLVLAWLPGFFGIGKKEGGRTLKLILGFLVICLPVILILKQPDMGSALVFLPLFLVMIWVAGAPVKMMGTVVLLLLIGALAFLSVVVFPAKMGISEEKHNALLKKIGISEYQKKRILVFLDSSHDPLGAGWNKAQSQIAIGSGRMWGKGYLQGTQNLLGYLPKTVAPNDFIFSVIAEEKGFSGAIVVILLLCVLIYSCIKTALQAPDMAGSLVASGIATLLFVHSFINIGMTIGILPITGIPLPLVSYGGTFLLGTAAGLGIVQSVYIRGARLEFLSENGEDKIFYTRKELLK